MRSFLVSAAAAATLAFGALAASAANAASLVFEFLPGPDSYVTVTDNDTLCFGSCAVSATLATLPAAQAVEEGTSWTFDFANFHVNPGLGFGDVDVIASLAFVSPSFDSAENEGYGTYFRAGTLRRPGILAGSLSWDGATEFFTTSNGSTFSVTFNDIGGFTNGGDATGTVTVSVLNVVPEPATWALMIGGFGLAGGMLRRQRAIAA